MSIDTRDDRKANQLRVVGENERATGTTDEQGTLPGLEAVIKRTMSKPERDAMQEVEASAGLLAVAAGAAAAQTVKLRALQREFERASAAHERAQAKALDATAEAEQKPLRRAVRIAEIELEAARDRLREARRTASALDAPTTTLARVAKVAVDRNLGAKLRSLKIEGADALDKMMEGDSSPPPASVH